MSRSNHVTPLHLTNQTIHREIHALGSSQPTFSHGLRARSTETGLETTRRASTAAMSRQRERKWERHVLLVGGEEERGDEEHPPDEGDEPHLGSGGGEATTGREQGGQAPRRWGPGLWSALSRILGSRRPGACPRRGPRCPYNDAVVCLALCAGTNPLAFFDIASVPPSCSLEFGMESEGLRQNVQGKFHLSTCEKHKGCVHVYTFYTLLVVKPRLRYHWECSSMVEGLLYAA